MISENNKKIIRSYAGKKYKALEKKNPMIRLFIKEVGLELDYVAEGKKMIKEMKGKKVKL